MFGKLKENIANINNQEKALEGMNTIHEENAINVNDNMYSFDHFRMYNFDYYAFLFSPNLSTTLGWGRDYRV